MPRVRWFVVGFLLLVAVAGGVLNERSPFDAHPARAYDQFLADFQAGRVEQIVQWRDRLEVTEQGDLLTVIVPAERDLGADLARARWAGGVGIQLERLPDAWLGMMTPWVAILLAVAAMVTWGTSVVRSRGSSASSAAGRARLAG